MKRAVAAALAALLLALLAACAGVPDRNHLAIPGAAREELLTPEGTTLAAKAEHFRREIDARFLSPKGTLQYVQRTGAEGFEYADLADVPIWGGALTGAEALRFLATRDPAARDATLGLVLGLDFLQEVTGVPGLLARNAVPRDAVPAGDGTIFFDAAPPHEEFLYRGDVSRDQYAGALFGYAMAFFALGDDPAVAAAVRAGAAPIADHLLANGFRLRERGGKFTKHGDLRVHWGGIVPIGVNAGISLLALKLAHLSTGEPRYAAAYRDLVADGAAGALFWSKFQVFGKTNQNNDNMQYMANLPLALLEEDPALRRAYLDALARTWEYVRLEGNSFFTFATASVLPVEARAIDEARDTLRRFPTWKSRLKVDVTDVAAFGRFPFTNRRGVPKADGALPISYRAPSTYAWRDDPFALVSGGEPEGDTVFSGADYLLAYWLGRATGFVGAND